MDNCLFCDKNNFEKEIILEDKLFYAKWDGHPVSKGHALIFPKKHIKSLFDLNESEIVAFLKLLKEVKKIIDSKYHPDAYNIGINDGVEAGRTIHHLHIHIIPRYKGDVDDPRGGVRHIIPGKGFY